MFKFLEKLFSSDKEELDSILSCAKYIIDNGELVKDSSSSDGIPNVLLQDDKGNTLYISWYNSIGDVHVIYINKKNVPTHYHNKIFSMARKRINYLQKKYVEENIKSVKK